LYGGSWWSTPVFSGLITTTPRLPDGTPAQLVFVEDPDGMRKARVAQLQPATDVRVLEINEPADLVDLVARYCCPWTPPDDTTDTESQGAVDLG